MCELLLVHYKFNFMNTYVTIYLNVCNGCSVNKVLLLLFWTSVC